METSDDFPALGIDTEALCTAVEKLLSEARESKEDLGAVNWGDLGVVDIEYRLSMLCPDRNGPYCVVMIEEASPISGLAWWIQERLDKSKFPRTFVECEW